MKPHLHLETTARDEVDPPESIKTAGMDEHGEGKSPFLTVLLMSKWKDSQLTRSQT